MIIIQLIFTITVLTILYVKMIKRETPSIGKAQAIVPVVFGIISLIVSVAISIGIGMIFLKLGYNKNNVDNLVLRSIIGAFANAGFPEEIGKFLFIMISVKIFKPKNVYEYLLIGFGTGMGFTLLEEVMYGVSFEALIRILIITFHSLMGAIMASYIGKAKYYKIHNEENKNTKLEYLKAFCIPILIHTLYDASNVKNAGLEEGVPDSAKGIAVIIALLTILITFILQIIVLIKIKKDAEKLISMKIE